MRRSEHGVEAWNPTVDSKVSLVHQTAREFLVGDSKISRSNTGTWKRSLQLAKSLLLTEICISYLLFGAFEERPLLLPPVNPIGSISKSIDRYCGGDFYARRASLVSAY